FCRFVHLLINARAQLAWVHIEADVRRDSLAVQRLAFGGVPAKDRKPHPVAAADLEVRGTEDIPGGLRTDDRREIMFSGKTGHHLCRAIGPFVHEDDYLSEEGLWSEPLSHQNNGFVPE